MIEAADGPGFLVNRCNRPFSLEALRIVQERLATPEQVDRICRRALGFRMGPFELMDLVGIDVGYAIARSFHDQTAEPRWRPSPLAARMAASGRLGRKTGRGLVRVPAGPPADPDPPAPGGGDGLVVVAGETALAALLLDAAGDGRLGRRHARARPRARCPLLIVDCGATEDDPPLQGGPQLLLCDAAPLARAGPGRDRGGLRPRRCRCSTARSSS